MITDQHIKRIISFLQPQQEESILLLKDATTQELVDRLAKELPGSEVIDLDAYRRPLGSVPADLLERAPDLLFYAVDKLSDSQADEATFRRDLAEHIEGRGGRVGNMLAVTPEVIESAFAADPHEIKELSERLREHMEHIRSVRVTSPAGTDITIRFGTYNWIASTGFIKRGLTRNVMPAEVYTHPLTADGTVVIDGTYALLLSDERFKHDKPVARTLENPLHLTVRDGRITNVYCSDKDVERAVRDVIDTYENADRIGEFGLGTNIGMQELKGHLGHDEKFPTVHLANGRGYPKETGAEYDCRIHHDGLIRDASVKELDTGQYVLSAGRYFV